MVGGAWSRRPRGRSAAAVPEAADVPPVDTPSVDTPSVDTPSVDTPSVDTPSVDTPSVDTPSVDTPRTDTPLAEAASVVAPAKAMPVDVPPVEGDLSGSVELPAGEPAAGPLSAMGKRDREKLEEHARQAESVAEVAPVAGAPVLKVVPGLSLAEAKKIDLLRISWWHPAQIAKEPDGTIGEYKVAPVGGLWGDGPFLLYDGAPVNYEDQGACLVAFAPVNAWGDGAGLRFTAQWMCSGVSIAERKRKHAVSDHDDRPSRIG